MSKAMRRQGGWRYRALGRVGRFWRPQGGDSDRGAGAIEYAGVVIIVAAIILAIRGLGLDNAISGAIAKAVNNILGG